ncbi:MAG: hypothetical protein ACYSU1_01435 [Planctomycetota bacterium]
MARFERRLRAAWALEVPCIPRHLQDYHQAWQDTLSAPLQEATTEEMTRSIRKADLLLVSDFHPLRRSRDGLAQLLRQVPEDRTLVLCLEMLPFGTTLTVSQALQQEDTPLVHGQSLQEAYAPVLRALRGRRAILVGTWVEGSVQRRDAAAVEVWERIRRRRGRFRGVFHFGDWHLAEEHLPQRLRALGEDPVVIHQSPEPVWERVGLGPRGLVYRLAQKHWVWLQTPPLGLWANHVQDLGHCDAEEAAEATEHLCESAAEHLAHTLGLPQPTCRLSVIPPQDWPTFYSNLPRRLASALDADSPPRTTFFHPKLPLVWSPGPMDLSHLIQGAAHTLICSSALRMEVGVLPEFRRLVFRNLCALLVNPFLDPPTLEALTVDLLPVRNQAEAQAAAGRVRGKPEQWQGLNAGAEMLLLEHDARKAASVLAGMAELEHAHLRKFLDPGQGVFDWDVLMATIRVA